jgi:hypothetical protein
VVNFLDEDLHVFWVDRVGVYERWVMPATRLRFFSTSRGDCWTVTIGIRFSLLASEGGHVDDRPARCCQRGTGPGLSRRPPKTASHEAARAG